MEPVSEIKGNDQFSTCVVHCTCKEREKFSWKLKISKLWCKLINLCWNKETEVKQCKLSSVLWIKQTCMYNNVNLLPIGTIEPLVLQNDILEQNMFYLHNRAQYVQHIHTREHVFARYTSMYAFHTKLKILKFSPKWLVNWLLANFCQKPVMKQQNHQIWGRTDGRWGNFVDGKDQ